jgi:hypothetical protein
MGKRRQKFNRTGPVSNTKHIGSFFLRYADESPQNNRTRVLQNTKIFWVRINCSGTFVTSSETVVTNSRSSLRSGALSHQPLLEPFQLRVITANYNLNSFYVGGIYTKSQILCRTT